jgi:hypothetical protein
MGLSWQAVMAHHGSVLVQPSCCVGVSSRSVLQQVWHLADFPPGVHHALLRQWWPAGEHQPQLRIASVHVSNYEAPTTCWCPGEPSDISMVLRLTSFSASAGLKGELYRFTGMPSQPIRNCVVDMPIHEGLGTANPTTCGPRSHQC